MLLKFKTSLKCNNCVNAIEPGMNSLQGVKTWNVDLASRPVTLEVETETTTAEEIINIVTKAGYRIESIS